MVRSMKHQFTLGDYRPIYLLAGPGTIRMNKVKFMHYLVDEVAHKESHGAVFCPTAFEQ